MAARLRPAMTSNTARGCAYRRGQSNSPRCFARARHQHYAPRPAAFSSLRRLHFEKPPDLSPRIDWSGHQPSRSRPAVVVFPVTPKRPSFRSTAAAGRRRNWLAFHCSPWERVQTPRQNIVSFAAELSCRNASGTITQHTLWVTLRSFIPVAQGTPRPCAGSK
jgi:hypothetical protein